MAFELKNNADEQAVFRQDFTTHDFQTGGYQSDAFHYELPGGEVRGRQWVFDGIRMIHSESSFSEPTELAWSGDTEMVTMHFNLKGKVSLTDLQTKKTFAFSNNQHNIFYGRKAEGTMKNEALEMSLFLVQFSKEAFFTLAGNGNDAIRRFADAVSNEQATAFSDFNLPIDFRIKHCIDSVLHSPYSQALERMFLLSKSIEMLVLQAESFDKMLNKKSVVLKTDYDKERISFARDYLLEHLASPPSLTELARVAGINEFKLKKGFKETFGLPAFQYVADVRLGLAKAEILTGRKSATEVAFELGYSSLAHFSSAFKKKFGVSPNQVKV
jgi:AraC-like DNA-binding protein